ncbi:MAG: hypothetical protein J0G37_12455 [Afipia sp.]|jgi:hypothetical protein|nr:hypothetical protein [Afipia sp.]
MGNVLESGTGSPARSDAINKSDQLIERLDRNAVTALQRSITSGARAVEAIPRL